MAFRRITRGAVFLLLFGMIAPLAFAQSTGSISGRVTASDGSVLPGVTVEARSNVLPQARVTNTSMNGEYRFPALPPGNFTVMFTLSGMQAVSRQVQVFLGQDAVVNVALGMAGVAEEITVTAQSAGLDTTSTEIRSAIDADIIEQLPTGQDYRDLVKLVPGAMYTEQEIRGPSAGGSGQDNVYQFDGVNVNMPLFGTLSAEPSAHDIQQFSVVKGGARAIDFNRSAGLTVDSVSKSGSSQYSGMLSYQLRTASMTADTTGASVSQFDEDRSWATANLGGPILSDRLFFYTSYYRPERTRTERSNAYGALPDFRSVRDELFGKLTFTPLANVLIHGSYRHSDRENRNETFGAFTHPSAFDTAESTQKIGILEGSWVINQSSLASIKVTDYAWETFGAPNTLLGVQPSLAPGTRLDLANLHMMGRVNIPSPISTNPSFNQFIAPIIDRYGYISNGVPTGGGIVGGALEINDQDFFRQAYQLNYDITLGSRMTHNLHFGYQWNKDEEDLRRVRNGWGDITVTGGRQCLPAFDGIRVGGAANCTAAIDQPIGYTARFIRGQLGETAGLTGIRSDIVSHNLEINDSIQWNNWNFNVGVLISQDTLYGQGLREDPSTISGFVAAPGNRYKMYEVDWQDMIQPRLGATWAYNGLDTVYASFSRYNPAATSLPRAAAWDRNVIGSFYDAFFDPQGNLMGYNPVGSSSGKLFADGLKPRVTDEYMIGTAQQFTSNFTSRLYGRYRKSSRFWEDTNNEARQRWAPEGYSRELYIPDLEAKRQQIGPPLASTYVIAQLDGAFAKYYEATMETEYRQGPAFLRGSYTFSHYYGNFDQDNTTVTNDANVFIGSSNLADGPGRQIWDNKYGRLRGDRPHMLKLYGAYTLPWNASAGAYGIYQSGEAWEAWDYRVYDHLPGFSGTSSLIRYAEPAGSRRTPDHYQIDLNYTQNIPIAGYVFQLGLDVFNLTDNQTGYNYEPTVTSTNFGNPRSFYSPRRMQLLARFQF